MKQNGFSYIVRAELFFTEKEAQALKACSEAHYDYKCKTASKDGGIVTRILNSTTFISEEETDWATALSSQELNLLLKICEMAWYIDSEDGLKLFPKLKKVFDLVQEEQRRLEGSDELLQLNRGEV